MGGPDGLGFTAQRDCAQEFVWVCKDFVQAFYWSRITPEEMIAASAEHGRDYVPQKIMRDRRQRATPAACAQLRLTKCALAMAERNRERREQGLPEYHYGCRALEDKMDLGNKNNQDEEKNP